MCEPNSWAMASSALSEMAVPLLLRFYETLKGSGQRVSSRIVIMLIEDSWSSSKGFNFRRAHGSSTVRRRSHEDLSRFKTQDSQ